MTKIKGKAAGLFIADDGMLYDADGVITSPANHRYLWFFGRTTGLDGSTIETFRAGTEKGDFIRCISKGKGVHATCFWDLWRTGLSNEREAYTRPAAPSESLMKKRVPRLKDPMDGGMFAATPKEGIAQ